MKIFSVLLVMSHFLYSTNPFMKAYINEEFRGDIHYVWCSVYFDPESFARHSAGSLLPTSSNPAAIYRDPKNATDSEDKGCLKILSQKKSFIDLAIKWEEAGEITTKQKEEIVYLIGLWNFKMWRPVLYIIPKHLISSERLEVVPIEERAGVGKEFRIKDLKRSEFDLIEFK